MNERRGLLAQIEQELRRRNPTEAEYQAAVRHAAAALLRDEVAFRYQVECVLEEIGT